MKKLLVIFLGLMITAAASAQDYKSFKVGLGFGYALAGGNGSSGGAIVTLEPAYRLSDAIAIGLRLETAALTRGTSTSISSGASLDVAAIGSYTINGVYYFSNNKFRPFVGAGIGMFTLAAVTGTSSGVNFNAASAETKFGFYPRVGFDVGHFSMSADYNLIGSTEIPSSTSTITNSYLGIRIGVFFGGGKR